MAAQREALERVLAASLDGYGEAVAAVARNYGAAAVARQFEPARAQVLAQGGSELSLLLDHFYRHVGQFRGEGVLRSGAWLVELGSEGANGAGAEAEER